MSNTGIADDVTAFLTGGGAKSAKFENVGDAVLGTIIAAKTAQQTDPATGMPKTWDNGDPMMQLIITLQTEEREGGDDDGKRNLYVKGSKKDPLTSAGALVAALRSAGASTIDVGGRLGVQFIGRGTPTKVGLSAPKHYAMRYVAPEANAVAGFLADTTAPAAPAQPAPQAPAPQPAAAPAGDPFAGL